MFELTHIGSCPRIDGGEPWSRRERGFAKRVAAKVTLLGLAAAVLFVFVGAAGATPTRVAAGIPACPAGTIAAELRPCIISSWVDPEGKYGSPVRRSLSFLS